MGLFIDLTGQRFGHWLVVARHMNNAKNNKARWICRCDCGNMSVVISADLRCNKSTNCGCIRKQVVGDMSRTHGQTINGRISREYKSWSNAKNRCFNKTTHDYKYYGGRGITMCEKWRNSFEAFLRDMGRCPRGKTIDRIDNDSHYEPGNCRWASRMQQTHNRRVSKAAQLSL